MAHVAAVAIDHTSFAQVIVGPTPIGLAGPRARARAAFRPARSGWRRQESWLGEKRASGGQLGFAQSDVRFDGHAIEARLYAEDPYAGFLPATGEVIAARWPVADGLRVDAGVGDGDVIGTRYDPLLAKLIAFAPSRAGALDGLDDALAAATVLGVTTNRGFLRWLLNLPEVVSGEMHTGLIDQQWQATEELPEGAWSASASSLVNRSVPLNGPA